MIEHSDFQKLKDSVARIEHAICGDEQMGHIGLVKDVEEIKRWRSRLMLRLSFISGAFVSVWEGVKIAAEYFKPHEK